MLYKEKVSWIIPFVENKKVLDLGCVDHSFAETKNVHWLHRAIVEHAREVVGVDYLAEEVDALRAEGFNVVCDNVETMSWPDKYEVIVAGDLIEHLNNFGMFLGQIAKHLRDDGVALLTTPNPVNMLRFVKVLFRGQVGANPEHTCWFTENVLRQLVDRHNLSITEVAYVDDSYRYYNFKWWAFLGLNWILCRIRHQFAETLCVAVRKKSGEMTST